MSGEKGKVKSEKKALVHRGNVDDVKCSLKHFSDITSERLKWEIDQEKKYKNRSTVIEILQRKLRNLQKEKS